ncbi:MAG: acetyl-CoA carboxylase biotin carboxyl carrier protein [Pseudomonadales bacterium]|nr:acetyl-CoA carboxylase biotin carboxyl carrier protein [Pseudomonadales bacterium]
MDLRKVKKLIELAEESDIAELEVTSGDESVRIRMNGHAATHEVVTLAANQASAANQTPAANQAPAAQQESASPITEADPGKPIVAPMAGTFYRAPGPEASAFVEVGQSVSAGDVVCIIESMKMMHEIRAAHGGTISATPVENGTPISTGEVLFVLS